jgi:methylated-DNA-[protein]-cysteine S-methyltransferase
MNETNPVYGKMQDTPVGTIWIAASARGLIAISLWPEEERFMAEVARLAGSRPRCAPEESAVIQETIKQLEEYFRGERSEFELPVDWGVMPSFQQEVLRLVSAVPYGCTTSYGDIARQFGKSGAHRAVGRANATNPLPIIIPCHRVLGSDGKLHGYGAPGGLETKAWLLRLEGSWLL